MPLLRVRIGGSLYSLTLPTLSRWSFPTMTATSVHNFSRTPSGNFNPRHHLPSPLCANGYRAIAEAVTGSKEDNEDELELDVSEFIEVGYISSVHGLKGELRMKPNTGFPELRFCKVELAALLHDFGDYKNSKYVYLLGCFMLVGEEDNPTYEHIQSSGEGSN